MQKISIIPAKISKFTKNNLVDCKKRRVCAYARVSTDHEEQLTSYEAQIDYYTKYIKGRADWEFAGIYTDEGISATNTKHREGFKTMIKDALNKKFDLIITKSVSRFARNTVDSLSTIRKLKENAIEVYFEKENIWTFDGKGELLITIMSSLAQEESRSISENCTWGQRKAFADGKVHVPYSRFLGYDKGENTLIVNKEQANIVKRIYFLYLKGYSPYSIATTLTKEKIKSPGGKTRWNASNIKSILTNEKYKGDALLQKSFTVDFLTKKKKKNEGEVQQYYITDNHEPIIDKEIFEIVQNDLKARKYKRTICTNFFSGQIVCKDCNSIYSPKVFHSTDKYKKRVFQCLNKQKNKCKTPNLTDDEIKDAFVTAANIVISKKDDIIKTYEKVVSKSFDTKELDEKLTSLNQKLIELEKKASDFIKENSKEVKDQDTYEKNYNELIKKYDDTKTKIIELEGKISEQKLKKATLIKYISDLKTAKLIKKFDEDMWRAMVVKVYVDDNGKLEFVMKNGEKVMI